MDAAKQQQPHGLPLRRRRAGTRPRRGDAVPRRPVRHGAGAAQRYQPIVLMADCQTTGGYPKIACVAQADLGRLAQIRFGGSVRFHIATAEEAAKLRRRNEAYLNQIRMIVREKC
uniref:Carboxyltransferase domain-containing protein n=1 Tax=Conchiformibius kuhniae TaxID=211502 RepID=A0A8T9MXV9_9NEIS|nr:hypothetical protein LVJ77_01600 [Conchiformibius kuhniae]